MLLLAHKNESNFVFCRCRSRLPNSLLPMTTVAPYSTTSALFHDQRPIPRPAPYSTTSAQSGLPFKRSS
jgi:hypothetical protein